MIQTLGGVGHPHHGHRPGGGDLFARIVMDVDGRHVEVDSRPSDAIALALRLGVPIFAEDGAGAGGDRAGGAEEGGGEEGEGGVDSGGALSAFRDVINQLNLDDLGK